MREAIGYIRDSSEEQADIGLGLEVQHRRIAAYCEMKGLRLVEGPDCEAVTRQTHQRLCTLRLGLRKGRFERFVKNYSANSVGTLGAL
jgi:hypothetical protein